MYSVIIQLKYERNGIIPLGYIGKKLIRIVIPKNNYNKDKLIENTFNIIKHTFPNIENFKLTLICIIDNESTYINDSTDVFDFTYINKICGYSDKFYLDKDNIISDNVNAKIDEFTVMVNELNI